MSCNLLVQFKRIYTNNCYFPTVVLPIFYFIHVYRSWVRYRLFSNVPEMVCIIYMNIYNNAVHVGRRKCYFMLKKLSSILCWCSIYVTPHIHDKKHTIHFLHKTKKNNFKCLCDQWSTVIDVISWNARITPIRGLGWSRHWTQRCRARSERRGRDQQYA